MGTIMNNIFERKGNSFWGNIEILYGGKIDTATSATNEKVCILGAFIWYLNINDDLKTSSEIVAESGDQSRNTSYIISSLNLWNV